MNRLATRVRGRGFGTGTAGAGAGAASFAPIRGLGNLNGGLYTDFREGSLTGARGGAWSLTRATATTSYDLNNLVVNISSGQPRWHRIGAGSGVTGLADWGAHTNVCLQSEDFGTTWAAAGSPTRSAGATTCGVVSLDLIGDDSGIALEGYTQTVTFTGDAVKAISFYFAKGTATSSMFQILDVTGVANRLLGAITWSGATPSITMTTGTLEGIDTLGNNCFRARVITTSVTAANTNSLRFYPATTDVVTDVTSTGTIYLGGVMAQNATSVFPYIKTTTAAVTVNADVITAAGAGIINDTEGTLYVMAAGPVDLTSINVLLQIDDGTSNERHTLDRSSAAKARFIVQDGGAAQANISAVASWTAGASGKFAARYRLNDSNQAFDGVAFGTPDTACTMPTTTTFRLGANSGGAANANTVIQVVAFSRVGASDANLVLATAP